MKSAEYWLISLPCKHSADNPTITSPVFHELKEASEDVSEIFPWELPSLRTGTLDRLMKAADSLEKLDLLNEQLIRKLERQFSEISNPKDALDEIEDIPKADYVQSFTWNSAKYPVSRQIDDLITSISSHTAKIEDELKQSSLYLQEKKQQLQFMQRKLSANLLQTDLKHIFTLDKILEFNLSETEYLVDLPVVVTLQASSNNEDKFWKSYEQLTEFVVPNSAQEIARDKVSVLYTVKVLKRFVDEYAAAAEKEGFTVRKFDYKPILKAANSKNLQIEEQSEQFEEGKVDVGVIETELRDIVQQMRAWCTAQYSEAFVSWMHVKAIRVFVESCLRYGIPPAFAIGLLRVKNGAERKLKKILVGKFGKHQEQIGEADPKDEEEILPFVLFTFKPFTAK
eukprot:maker-scaffold_48-snap-gene-1.41-mRNA-1 protein AED:0.02 eAED:0.02 QI:28/1/1/1/1/1/4/892/396